MASTEPRGSANPAAPPRAEPRPSRFWLVDIYRTAVGKKYAMAISGIVLMAYVLLHMIGNLKLYVGPESMEEYAQWLREFGEIAAPFPSPVLWLVRVLLLVAFLVHIHAAYSLTIMNRRARPQRYQSKREYVTADFAARTMRWTGVIILLFVLFHLADLTFGWANPNPDFVYAQNVYDNVVYSFSNPFSSAFYIVANLALGLHLYHGAWSLFQTMGWNNPRFNHWRRWFAVAFALVVVVPNISFPVAVLTGVIA